MDIPTLDSTHDDMVVRGAHYTNLDRPRGVRDRRKAMPEITVCKGCGQAMQAVDKNNKPACTTCIGISKESGIEVKMKISDHLVCQYRCGSCADWNEKENVWEVQCSKAGGWNGTDNNGRGKISIMGLPFMDAKKGLFYCGCYGWD